MLLHREEMSCITFSFRLPKILQYANKESNKRTLQRNYFCCLLKNTRNITLQYKRSNFLPRNIIYYFLFLWLLLCIHPGNRNSFYFKIGWKMDIFMLTFRISKTILLFFIIRVVKSTIYLNLRCENFIFVKFNKILI